MRTYNLILMSIFFIKKYLMVKKEENYFTDGKS